MNLPDRTGLHILALFEKSWDMPYIRIYAQKLRHLVKANIKISKELKFIEIEIRIVVTGDRDRR